jgi:hypothetical protein
MSERLKATSGEEYDQAVADLRETIDVAARGEGDNHIPGQNIDQGGDYAGSWARAERGPSSLRVYSQAESDHSRSYPGKDEVTLSGSSEKNVFGSTKGHQRERTISMPEGGTPEMTQRLTGDFAREGDSVGNNKEVTIPFEGPEVTLRRIKAADRLIRATYGLENKPREESPLEELPKAA